MPLILYWIGKEVEGDTKITRLKSMDGERKNTSRKLCGKEPQSFSHCGPFDHLDLLVTKRLRICFFLGLPTEILSIWGLVISR